MSFPYRLGTPWSAERELLLRHSLSLSVAIDLHQERRLLLLLFFFLPFLLPLFSLFFSCVALAVRASFRFIFCSAAATDDQSFSSRSHSLSHPFFIRKRSSQQQHVTRTHTHTTTLVEKAASEGLWVDQVEAKEKRGCKRISGCFFFPLLLLPLFIRTTTTRARIR